MLCEVFSIVIALSRDQCREINRGLEHILAPNATEIYRGPGWAKTAGLGQRAHSGPSTSGGRDLQGLNGTRTADFTVMNARNAWQSRSNRVCQISCVAMFSWGADLQRFFNQDL